MFIISLGKPTSKTSKRGGTTSTTCTVKCV